MTTKVTFNIVTVLTCPLREVCRVDLSEIFYSIHMGDSMKWLHWDENKIVACFILFLIILKADSLNFHMLESLSKYLVSFSSNSKIKLADIWYILQWKSTLYSCCSKQMKNAFWVIKPMLERCSRLLSVTINRIHKPSYLEKKMKFFPKIAFSL